MDARLHANTAPNLVTHGEPEAADALRARIDHELGWSVAVPEYLQTVDLV